MKKKKNKKEEKENEREKLELLCIQALKGEKLPIRFIPQVIGKVVSPLPGVECRRFHHRQLERDKILTLAHNAGNYDSIMSLSYSARAQLQWWVEKVHQAFRNTWYPSVTCIFETDASPSRWGSLMFNGPGGRHYCTFCRRALYSFSFV